MKSLTINKKGIKNMEKTSEKQVVCNTPKKECICNFGYCRNGIFRKWDTRDHVEETEMLLKGSTWR